MKSEYDFSGAERGRFFRGGATLFPPIHLDADVLTVLMARADAERISLDDLVNALLRETIGVPERGSPA